MPDALEYNAREAFGENPVTGVGEIRRRNGNSGPCDPLGSYSRFSCSPSRSPRVWRFWAKILRRY